ncbi:thiamine pyrophosphate-binding protein [Pseudomonas sp. RIT-PI-AD]|uniref:thiamine pyrophosphate-binding protein n=1 Tax=Pseudomonas sp. RIT-PI-AD TaxID=3035294 RepID=UPI0021DA55BA|nr:thiamine pyrophosphate-binding protein [Pseudomonas sp. RIT-PI-AD]
MSRNNAAPVAEHPAKRLWQRWRFHLNALLLVVPLVFMSKYLHDQARFSGKLGLGEREIGELAVGPWTLRLAEWEVGDPEDEGQAGYMKAFVVALCETCSGEIKAAYLRIGQPRSLRAAGALLSGNPYRLIAEVPVPPRASAGDRLWITVEGWDGAVHQATLPLEQASPSLIAWLGKGGNAR